MTEPISTSTPGARPRALLPLILFAAAAIPVAIYLNKASVRWVPDADAKVASARKLQAAREFSQLRDDALQHPEAGAVQTRYAQALADQGRLVEAAIPAERAVKADPSNAAARLLVGDILAPLAYREEAVAAYRGAIRLDPGNLLAYQHLGDLMVATGQPGEAEKIFRDAQKRYPDSPGPLLSLAQLYLQQSKSPLVISTLDPLLKTSDPPAAALFMAGKASVTVGQSLRGIELFRRALQKQPDFADAQHALGSALANQGRYSEGIEALKRAVDLSPENPTYRYALGNALLSDTSHADHLDRALAQFEASLEREPLSEWTHYYYGIALEQKGELESAGREYRRVLEINPEFASCYWRLGSLYRAQGRTAEARQLLAYFDRKSKNAITKVHDERRDHAAIDSAEYRYKRGQAALRAGNRELARSEYQAALARDPNHAAAKRGLESLQGARP